MIWPADRFYWAVLDAPGISTGPLPIGLWPLFEEEIPVHPGSLWAVCASLGQGSVIVCAAPRDQLQLLDADTLNPDSVPDALACEVPPDRLNLLIGEYEPRASRRARARRHVIASAAVLLCAALIGIGLFRRAQVWRADANRIEHVTQTVLDSVAPSLGWNEDNLAMELIERREAHPVDLNTPEDASLALAALIAGWPTQVRSKPQSISASGESASISVTVRGDVNAFLAALTLPPGWLLEEPRLAAIDQFTRLTLDLRRASP